MQATKGENSLTLLPRYEPYELEKWLTLQEIPIGAIVVWNLWK